MLSKYTPFRLPIFQAFFYYFDRVVSPLLIAPRWMVSLLCAMNGLSTCYSIVGMKPWKKADFLNSLSSIIRPLHHNVLSHFLTTRE